MRAGVGKYKLRVGAVKYKLGPGPGAKARAGGSMALRCGSFPEKNIEKRHLCCHDKNYYYFAKPNIPATKGTLMQI